MELLGVFILIVGQAMLLLPSTAANPITALNISSPINSTAVNVTNVNTTNGNATSANATSVPVCNNTHAYCCRKYAGDVPTLGELYAEMNGNIDYLYVACTNDSFKLNVS